MVCSSRSGFFADNRCLFLVAPLDVGYWVLGFEGESDRTTEAVDRNKRRVCSWLKEKILLHNNLLDAWDLGVGGRFLGLETRRSRQPMVVGALLDAEWIAQNRHSGVGLLMSR